MVRLGGNGAVLRLVLLALGELAGRPGARAVRLVLRAALNRMRRRVAHWLLHRTVFGERSQGRLLPHTRVAPSTCIEGEQHLALGDHVYIGVLNFIEASGGVSIGEGTQITHHVSIVTHSSHRAQRLLGRRYAEWPGDKPGWVDGPVAIGPYCFIGPHSLIEANTELGRGCIVRAGSVVRGRFADFSVLEGRPATVVGDARAADRRWLERHPELREAYEAWAGGLPPQD
jgi:acetyltransferase-like isoleucine patch superfamily enzyme